MGASQGKEWWLIVMSSAARRDLTHQKMLRRVEVIESTISLPVLLSEELEDFTSLV